jgi:hypothetical protein
MNLQAMVNNVELVQRNLAVVARMMELGKGEILTREEWKNAHAALSCLLHELTSNAPSMVARTRAALALSREADDLLASPSMTGNPELERLAATGAADLVAVANWLVERNKEDSR